MVVSPEIRVPAHLDPGFATGVVGEETINVKGLERHLPRHVKGEVRFDRASLAMYANDASMAMYANDASNFRQVPIGVVVPRTLDDLVATVVACSRYRAPVLSQGGTGRQALHLAEVMALARCADASPPSRPKPPLRRRAARVVLPLAGLIGAAALGVGAAAVTMGARS
jgi:hypothetical protein